MLAQAVLAAGGLLGRVVWARDGRAAAADLQAWAGQDPEARCRWRVEGLPEEVWTAHRDGLEGLVGPAHYRE